MKRLVGILALLALLGLPLSTYAATANIENFDSYTNGTSLNGQGGWTTVDTNAKITNTQSQSSPNSLIWSNLSGGTTGLNLTVPTLSADGSQIIFYIRANITNNAAGGSVGLAFFTGSTQLFTARLSQDQHALQLIGATTVTLLNLPAVDTWYKVTTEFDFTGDRARAAIDAGAMSSYVSAVGSVGFANVDGLGLVLGGLFATSNMYMDSISSFSPSVASTDPFPAWFGSIF